MLIDVGFGSSYVFFKSPLYWLLTKSILTWGEVVGLGGWFGILTFFEEIYKSYNIYSFFLYTNQGASNRTHPPISTTIRCLAFASKVRWRCPALMKLENRRSFLSLGRSWKVYYGRGCPRFFLGGGFCVMTKVPVDSRCFLFLRGEGGEVELVTSRGLTRSWFQIFGLWWHSNLFKWVEAPSCCSVQSEMVGKTPLRKPSPPAFTPSIDGRMHLHFPSFSHLSINHLSLWNMWITLAGFKSNHVEAPLPWCHVAGFQGSKAARTRERESGRFWEGWLKPPRWQIEIDWNWFPSCFFRLEIQHARNRLLVYKIRSPFICAYIYI